MQKELVIIAVLAVVVVVLGVALYLAKRRSELRSGALRDQFGPEYERAIAQHGDRSRAERELLSRRNRLDELNIHPLTEAEADRFSADWGTVQQRFVDDPSGAVNEADRLIKDVMKARGYPVGNFDQRVADLSVEHANVVEHYRAARQLARAREEGDVGTEELRQAMVHYRALFSDLLRTEQVQPALQPAHA